MKTIKTYKYKLRNLSKGQEETLYAWIGSCRCVYNLAKEVQEESYKKGVSISMYDMQKQLVPLKKEFDWIKDVPSQSLQDVIERLYKAYKAFFKGGGYPQWAKKDQYNSITLKSIKALENGRFSIPKLGEIKTFYSREIPSNAKLKRATILKESNGFYISIMFEGETIQLGRKSQAVGLDWGIAHFLTTSDGDFIENPRLYQKYSKELRREQRSLSGKVKRSKNFYKQAKRVAKLQAKIARVRNDFQHKVSIDLVRRYDLIAIERLNIKGISKSAQGDQEEHGRNVKAKSGLNREILDTAPSMFFEKLEYKSAWYGRELVKVDPKYTSQTCSECGHTEKQNRQTQSKFVCRSCGVEMNADVNGAKNILDRAISNSSKRGALARA